MKKRHDGDCTIYSCLDNNMPESGICICGYGLEQMRRGNHSELYSKELLAKMDKERVLTDTEIDNIFEHSLWTE